MEKLSVSKIITDQQFIIQQHKSIVDSVRGIVVKELFSAMAVA
jgi:hypothetical protein